MKTVDENIPPALRQRRPRPVRALPAPRACGCLLVRLEPRHTAMFRFLLEAAGHTVAFSVLEPKTALLKVFFSPHCEDRARRTLEEIGQTLPLRVLEWPARRRSDAS